MRPTNRANSTTPLIRIGLWILLLVSAMLLPFLPGRYDPLASTLGGFRDSGHSRCRRLVELAAASAQTPPPVSDEERRSAPDGADLGLGCGNPQAIAFLAARQVGASGSVIGVDMTAEMISKARANVLKTDLHNVEFRLGEIEHLPVADESVDVIMSNCVSNLSTDKPAVFGEAYRVLAPGGRLTISDIVALREIPAAVRNDLEPEQTRPFRRPSDSRSTWRRGTFVCAILHSVLRLRRQFTPATSEPPPSIRR